MKWSEYDLQLREWCIKNGKPIPGKPEAEYPVNWKTNPFFNGTPREYKTWGANVQVAIKLNDYETSEQYWEAIRKNAAKNLDALCNRH